MAGGAAVDGGMAGFLGDMRGHAGLPQIGDEIGAVVSLVRPERPAAGRAWCVPVDHLQCRLALGVTVGLGDLRLHDQPVAVLHQSMAHEAQYRPGAWRLLVEPRLGVSHRGMRRVRPPLPVEVDFGVAVLAGRLGHRIGLGRYRFRGGGVRGWRRRRWIIRSALRVGGRRLRLRLKALHRGPGLDERAVDREMLVRQQRRNRAVGQDRGLSAAQ